MAHPVRTVSTLTLLYICVSHAAAQSGSTLCIQEATAKTPQQTTRTLQDALSMSDKNKKSLLVRFDSLLSKMYEANTDTLYVSRPHTRWTFKIKTDIKATAFTVNGTDNTGTHYVCEMNSREKETVGFNISYKGLSGSFSVNPAHLKGEKTDMEWFFNLYTNSFGCDISVNNLHSFTGFMDSNGQKTDTDLSAVKLQSFTVNGYYVFNKHKFSYPAAFTQSYIQKRSRGSFLLGASFSTGNIETPANLLQTDEGYSIRRIGMTHAAFGAGYAYNYVPGKHWLLHLSALPTFVVWKNYNMQFSDGSVKMPWQFFDLFITGRFSATYYTGNYFFGITYVYQVSKTGKEEKFLLTKENFKARLFAGIRF